MGQMKPQKPSKAEFASNLRRAVKRADRWRRSKRTSGAPPRHILEKMQMTHGMEVS